MDTGKGTLRYLQKQDQPARRGHAGSVKGEEADPAQELRESLTIALEARISELEKFRVDIHMDKASNKCGENV